MTFAVALAYPRVPSTTGVAGYAGMEVNEAKRMKDLELENNKLKRILAEKLLEVEALKDLISKKW